MRGLYKREKYILLIVILAALSVRLLLMLTLQSYIISENHTTTRRDVENGWAFGYEAGRIAKSLATGEGFSSPFPSPTGSTAWLMPLYPFFLALIFKLFGIYTIQAAVATLTIHCLISALTCIPLYHIAKKLFTRNIGYITAVAFAFYPPSIWHAINTIWDTTLFTFFSMLLISWLVRPTKQMHIENSIIHGIFIGIIALVNPVIIVYYLFIPVWLYLKSKNHKIRRHKYIGTMLLAAAMILTPWLVRNYIVLGRPMLRSNFGLELRLGNSKQTWNTFTSTGERFPPTMEVGHPSFDLAEYARFARLGEVAYNDACLEEAWQFISANPRAFLRLTMSRIQGFWLGELARNNEWVGNIKAPFTVTRLKQACYILPLPFMIAGLIWAFKRKIEIWPLAAFLLLIPLVYYITHISQRYRYPIEPIVLVLAIYGFHNLIQFAKDQLGFLFGFQHKHDKI